MGICHASEYHDFPLRADSSLMLITAPKNRMRLIAQFPLILIAFPVFLNFLRYRGKDYKELQTYEEDTIR